MRRTGFTLMILVMSASLLAQEGFHLGVQATPQVPLIINQNTYGDPEYEYAATISYAAGIEMGFHVSDRLGLFTGFQYVSQGQEYEDMNDLQQEINRHVMLDYWRVPLYLRFSSADEGIAFYANAGAYFGFLNSAEIEYHIGPANLSIEDASDRFMDNDFGLLAGLGGQFYLSDELYATAGFRLTYGLSDINEEQFRDPNGNGVYEASHNASLGVNVGIAYVFGSGY